MPLIVTRIPRTRQPQGAVPLNPAWTARGLVYASTLTSGRPDETRVAVQEGFAPFGRTAEFSAFGAGYIQAALVTNPARRTWVISIRSDTSGVSSFPRILDQANTADALYVNDTDIRLEFVRSFSGARGQWAVPRPATGTPFTVAISLDASSASNDPIVCLDGVMQTVTELEAPSGTADTSGSSPWYIANRASADRDFDGGLANLLVFDAALPARDLTTLTRNPHQVYAPIERRIWVPSAGGAVPSITAVYADSVTASSVVPRVTLDFA